MEIDDKNLRDALAFVFERLRALNSNFAHRIVLETLKMTNAVPDMPWEDALQKSSGLSPLVEKLESKYKAVTDDLFSALDAASLQAKVLELLRKWQPIGPPN